MNEQAVETHEAVRATDVKQLELAAASGRSPATLFYDATNQGLDPEEARKAVELGMLTKRQAGLLRFTSFWIAAVVGCAVVGFLLQSPRAAMWAAVAGVFGIGGLLGLVASTVFRPRLRLNRDQDFNAFSQKEVKATTTETAAQQLERLLQEGEDDQQKTLKLLFVLCSLLIVTIPVTLLAWMLTRLGRRTASSRMMQALRSKEAMPALAHIEVRRGNGVEAAFLNVCTISLLGKRKKLKCPIALGEAETVLCLLVELVPDLLLGDTAENRRRCKDWSRELGRSHATDH